MMIWPKGLLSAALVLFAGLAVAGGIQEWGGSNYIAIGLNPIRLRSQADWKDSTIMKTPACALRRGVDRVRRDLAEMRKNGQVKLAVVLWHLRRSDPEDCRGFILRSNGGQFSARVMENLLDFLHIAEQLGFEEVQMRFAPQWRNSPQHWSSWEQDYFDENWSVIRRTIEAIRREHHLPIVYDLGAELGGLVEPGCAQCPEYDRRIWKKFKAEFPDEESYGFSIAYAPGRLDRLIKALRPDGPLPKYFAVDIYGDPHRYSRLFLSLSDESRSNGIASPHFLIQETYYADPETYTAILAAARSANISIKAVMQWPLQRGSSLHQVSEPATPTYIYKPAN